LFEPFVKQPTRKNKKGYGFEYILSHFFSTVKFIFIGRDPTGTGIGSLFFQRSKILEFLKYLNNSKRAPHDLLEEFAISDEEFIGEGNFIFVMVMQLS
jgi:hypothetical protein